MATAPGIVGVAGVDGASATGDSGADADGVVDAEGEGVGSGEADAVTCVVGVAEGDGEAPEAPAVHADTASTKPRLAPANMSRFEIHTRIG